jgi:hypothetical protein
VLPELIRKTKALIPSITEQYEEVLTTYLLYAFDLLEQANVAQSPRRARMLFRFIAAVHAARLVLEGETADIEQSAELALINGLPQRATTQPPEEVLLLALHKQAWAIASHEDQENWRVVMEESDPIKRILVGDKLTGFSNTDLSSLITQALGAQENDARRFSLSVALFLAFHQRRDLDASAWEPLAHAARRVMEPRPLSFAPADVDHMMEIRDWLMSHKGDLVPRQWLERNFVLGGFPQLWERFNWREELTHFQKLLNLFGVEASK